MKKKFHTGRLIIVCLIVVVVIYIFFYTRQAAMDIGRGEILYERLVCVSAVCIEDSGINCTDINPRISYIREIKDRNLLPAVQIFITPTGKTCGVNILDDRSY